jgi:hypothetical protein
MLFEQPRRTVFGKGQIVTEKNHEADESRKDCDCSHDVGVRDTALLRLV